MKRRITCVMQVSNIESSREQLVETMIYVSADRAIMTKRDQVAAESSPSVSASTSI